MGWSLLAKACMLAYGALLIFCIVEDAPRWTYALFAAFLVIGLYAEYRADEAKRRTLTSGRRHG